VHHLSRAPLIEAVDKQSTVLSQTLHPKILCFQALSLLCHVTSIGRCVLLREQTPWMSYRFTALHTGEQERRPIDGKPERRNKWLFPEIVCLPLDDRQAWDAWKGSSLSVRPAGKTEEIE
jgi:hypothetical protein